MTKAAFSRFPVLMTERLILRQLVPRDAEALFAIKSNGEVTQHYGQEPHQTIADSLGWIERLQQSYARREDIAWAVTLRAEDRLIGVCTLWNLDERYHYGEIGYELHPDYERRGYMTEALKAILTFAFDDFGLYRIEATPFDGNEASVKLLLRLGFTQEGILRQRHYFRGQFLDQLYFGLLREDWKEGSGPNPHKFNV